MKRLKHLMSVLVMLACMAASPLWAAEQGPEARGNKAYNEGRYGEAEKAFIEAIQARPEEALLYRNLARTYFWQNQYSAATAYYDFYLRLVPEAEDAEQIRSERRLASNRAGGEAWAMPEGQRMALRALQEELLSGRAYTAGAGGAWGLYRTLLRMQYAQPELMTLRRDLLRRLVDEFEAHLIAPENQPSPVLELEDWRVQNERLAAARGLSNDEAFTEMLARRALIVDAATALLNHQFDRAIVLLEEARAQNADMLFLNWYHVHALARSGKHGEALEILESFARRLAQSAPQQLGYARIVRASLLQSMGRSDDAAQLYLEMFLE